MRFSIIETMILTVRNAEPKENRKFPGLVMAAKRLHVSYSHLHGVLTGRKISPALLEKYQSQFDEAGEPLKTIPKVKPPQKRPKAP